MQSARKIHGNAWDWVLNISVMHGNERKYQGNVCKWVKSPRGMQGNAIGTYNCAKCQGNAWECKGLCSKCQRNAGGWEILGERM